MDQSLVHTFSWGNSYGPMVLKVLQRFPPTLVLVHRWLFPAAHPPKRNLRKIHWNKAFSQKPGDHPNFRKNALGVERPFSELSESSGVFSEQLSELEIPFSEYEIPFSEWPLTT